jgi:hypothetical protein
VGFSVLGFVGRVRRAICVGKGRREDKIEDRGRERARERESRGERERERRKRGYRER